MKRKTNVEGFSLVEMVVAMGILSIFIPIMVSMMVTATTARNVAIQTSKNSSSSSAISSVLENDIKRSGTFQSYPSSGKINTIYMAQADGKCVAWRIENGNIQRAEVDGTKLTSIWKISWDKAPVYSDKANGVGTEGVFTWVDGTRDKGKLQYKIQLGDKKAASIIESVVLPEVTGNGKGYCW